MSPLVSVIERMNFNPYVVTFSLPSKVSSRLKSKNYVFEEAFLTTFFGNYSVKTHKREHIIIQNCNHIIRHKRRHG